MTLLSVIAMFANILRFHYGITVVAATSAIMIIKLLRKEKVLVPVLISFAIMGLTYNLAARTIPVMISSNWSYPSDSAHGSSPYHTLLIGLGYIENEYGLVYDDNSAGDYIRERYPDVVYNSDEYYEKCKTEIENKTRQEPAEWFL